MRTAILLGSLLPLCLATTAHAGMGNPSFENPNVANGTYQNFPVGAMIGTKWKVIGPPGTGVSIISGPYTEGVQNFHGQHGNQFVDLTGDGKNRPEGIEQTVKTKIGTRYTLTFYGANVVTQPAGINSTINVQINGVQVMAALNTLGANTAVWKQYSHTFTATTAQTTIAFINGDQPGDHFNGIDNVNLTP